MMHFNRKYSCLNIDGSEQVFPYGHEMSSFVDISISIIKFGILMQNLHL